jgi:hypothetical protein
MIPTRRHAAWLAVALLLAPLGCRRTPPGLVAAADGVVLDQRTGLEWTARDHQEALPWDDADRHCRELAVGERRGWRLPELAELEAIYDARIDTPCGDRNCHLDKSIRLGGPYVWTVTTRGPGTRFYFDFSYGTSFSPGPTPTLVRRTICVRAAR